jgi:phosphoribosylformylglycinamidine cyclo-ligase
MNITYKNSGIDYSKIDPLKVMAQAAAKSTAGNLEKKGFREVALSRGESAYVVDMGDFYIATVTECLGTKSLIADDMRKITGKQYYDLIAKDTVAMAVNDLLSVGALPLVVHAYWATSGSEWFDDAERMKSLVEGWKTACDESGASWGGGETPGLSGVVAAGACDLAASCMGIIQPKTRLAIGERLEAGDAILILESSGIHANGISLARKLASSLPEGYATRMDDGRMFGEALLDPTILYVKCVRDLFEAGADIKYISNITGHGWRKVMRHTSEFTYVIDAIPPVPKVLEFVAAKAGLDVKEAYGTFNMGAGYAIFMPEQDAAGAIEVCRSNGIKAYKAGKLVKGKRSVVIKQLGIEYEGESLALRG